LLVVMFTTKLQLQADTHTLTDMALGATANRNN